MNTELDPSNALVDFALNQRFEQLPPSVVLRTKMALIDTLAATFAGQTADTVTKITALVCRWGGAREASAYSAGRRLPVPAAVLLNSVAARVLDLDDVHEQNTCHVSASIVPAALAISEVTAKVSGAELLTALAVASELCCRIAAAPRISFTETGQSLSYHCGFFSSAIVASRLRGLSPQQTMNALGIAYARVAGNQQGFLSGADTVSLMQGMAAQAGVEAALMAEEGLSGAHNIFEGRFGYFHTYHRGLHEVRELTENLGHRWRMQETSIKPMYPCCKFAQGPVEALLQAMTEAVVEAGELEEIRVEVSNREVFDIICSPAAAKWAPGSVREAQFSLPFLMAWAAIYRGVDLSLLAHDSWRDADVLELARRVHIDLKLPDSPTARGRFPMPGVVQITTRSGLRVDKTVEYVSGHPSNPMSREQLLSKFSACTGFGRQGWHHGDELVALIFNLEHEDSVTHLTRLCA